MVSFNDSPCKIFKYFNSIFDGLLFQVIGIFSYYILVGKKMKQIKKKYISGLFTTAKTEKWKSSNTFVDG